MPADLSLIYLWVIFPDLDDLSCFQLSFPNFFFYFIFLILLSSSVRDQFCQWNSGQFKMCCSCFHCPLLEDIWLNGLCMLLIYTLRLAVCVMLFILSLMVTHWHRCIAAKCIRRYYIHTCRDILYSHSRSRDFFFSCSVFSVRLSSVFLI